MSDHVHVFASLPATVTISETANALKANSSRWIRESKNSDFHWQKGYGAFSVSRSAEKRVIEYIRNQEEHHRTLTFSQEFVALLERHGIEYEERYLRT